MTDRENSHRWMKGLSLDELGDGRVKQVTCDTETVCMTRFDGVNAALDNACPHQGGPLGEGSIEKGFLRCPWHGWDFHPTTGRPPGGFDDGVLRLMGSLANGQIASCIDHRVERDCPDSGALPGSRRSIDALDPLVRSRNGLDNQRRMLQLVLITAVSVSTAPPCNAPLEPPETPPLAADVRLGSLYDWAGGYEDAPLGVGHLRLEGREDIWDWWMHTALPLYDRAEGERFGWFANGLLVDVEASAGGTTTPMGTSGMVETSYESMSFLVLEHRSDGWLRFRYGKPSLGRDGTAWTPACRVEGQGLRFESWEARFTNGEISVLTFRSPVPHALRAAPGVTAEIRHWIGGSHHLVPLEFRDDWMRVRVTEPSDYCYSDEIEVVEYEGWVRWRGPDKGPWVWYFTRGC